MLGRSVFREGALAKMAGLDDLDKLMRVTSPGAWLSLLALVLILVVLLIWGVVGSLTRTATGQGILIREGGIIMVESPIAGRIEHLDLTEGAHITKGAELARIVSVDGKVQTLRAEHDGTVLEVTARQGMEVAPQTALARLEPNTPLVALVYVPASETKSIRGGMEAHLLPVPLRPEEFGYLRGSVLSVARYPTSSQRVRLVLQNETLANQMTAAGPVVEVQVALLRDSDGNLLWTGAKRPPFLESGGALCSAQIQIEKNSPLQMALPTPKRANP